MSEETLTARDRYPEYDRVTMSKSKTIMLIVTYKCNLYCTYCYEPKSLHKQMTAEQVKSYITKAVDSLDDSYTEFEVQFMGGVPLTEFTLIKDVSEWLRDQLQYGVKLIYLMEKSFELQYFQA